MKSLDQDFVELTKSYRKLGCRQNCQNFCLIVLFSTLIASILLVSAFLGNNQWSVFQLKTSLKVPAASGELHTQQMSRLRIELDSLRVEVAALMRAMTSLHLNSSTRGAPLDYDLLDRLLDPRLAKPSSDRSLPSAPAKVDADAARLEALEMLVAALHLHPELRSDPRILVRLGAARYFQAMRVFAEAPGARHAVLQMLRVANHTLHLIPPETIAEYSQNRTIMAIYYKLLGVIEGRFATIDATLPPTEKIASSLRIRRFMELALENCPEDADVNYALGRWHYKVSSLGTIERAAFNVFGGEKLTHFTPATLETAIEYFERAVALYEKFVEVPSSNSSAASPGAKVGPLIVPLIGPLVGLARALYRRGGNDGNDRSRAFLLFERAKTLIPMSSEDRIERVDLAHGIDYVPE